MYVVQLMRERNIEATMEWECDDEGFETLIVTPIDSEESGEADEESKEWHLYLIGFNCSTIALIIALVGSDRTYEMIN